MNVGSLRHLVTLHNPGDAVSDGDGGFTESWTLLTPPQMYASIMTATARDMERMVSSTVQSMASHIMEMRYHRDVTTKTRVTWTDVEGRSHTASVTFVDDVEQRGKDLRLACVEVVP